ncbi:MAG: replication-associated recombination protein A [Eubacteriales bacterium]
MPLAEDIRPTRLDEICGQTHILGKGAPLRRLIESGHIPNLTFYGPPGTGKTTVAGIIASLSNRRFYKINATTSTVADVRKTLEGTDSLFAFDGILIYIDEIQYFNKKQQQTLLEHMEDGRATLITSTTESPRFALYPAFLSRCTCFEFFPIKPKDILPALERGILKLFSEYGEKTFEEGFADEIARACGGDMRRALNTLENIYFASGAVLEKSSVSAFAASTGWEDRDAVYDLLSALQKSVRGSDPDASVFYLARLLKEGGLEPACRRLLVMASEDVGLANPHAPATVKSCVDSALSVGMPEAGIILSNAVLLLATSPKSNSSSAAYFKACEDIDKAARSGEKAILSVPAHLINTNENSGYLYPHDFPGHYVKQDYLPEGLKNRTYFEFGENKTEKAAREYWQKVKEKS